MVGAPVAARAPGGRAARHRHRVRELWDKLAAEWEPPQLVELVATVGFYHFVSFTANALGVEPEEYAERFPVVTRASQPER